MVSWPERQEQWRRFAAWEAARLRGVPPDPAEAWAWMAEAYDLARRSDPTWGIGLDLDHVRHLQLVRRALACMELPA